MNRKLTAVLLIAAAVLANAAFTALGTVFNYPDVLKEPAADILVAFRESQAAVTGWFAVLALSSALFAPIAIGVGRLSDHRAMRIAVPVGIAAAVVQVIGLSRWPLLVPGYAADAASGDPAVADAAMHSFVTAHHILGNLIGETFGYLFTAAWTLLVLRAADRGARRPVVRRARRHRCGSRRRRCPLPVEPAADRHRQLLRLRAVERLAHRLRRPAAGPAADRRYRCQGCSGRCGAPMTAAISSPVRTVGFVRPWLLWTVGFVSFPIAGLVGTAVGGRVDSPLAALLGGLATGAVIGLGQGLASSRRLPLVRWILASAVGMGLGLLLGATVVGFVTGLTDLAVMGAITGLLLGVAQASVLPGPTRTRLVWAVAMPLLWALGWTVSTLIGIDVEQQFTIYGASGAVTFSALSGVLLHLLRPARPTAKDQS